MAHKSTTLTPSGKVAKVAKVARAATATPVLPVPGVDGEPFPATVAAGPFLSLNWGRKGRPDASRDAVIAAAFDILSDALARIPDPKPLAIPKNAPARVRAAYAAEHVSSMAGLTLARTAVANGRARTR